VVVIKGNRIRNRHLHPAVQTLSAVQLALEQAVFAGLVVGRTETGTAQLVGLGLIELGWFGGEAETAGLHFV
jgi:hypothetical protein